MSDDQVDWVGLEEVIAAADRGLAPLGPEYAGFVVLEAATRVRDVGGGVVRASDLVVDGNGQVHLTRPPRRADESKATSALRALLQRLLEVATSSTPALRGCARRKDSSALASLVRELEGALIPLNRAASRRGVARVAKATLDAVDAGKLPRVSTSMDDPSSPPAPAASDPTPSPNATVALEDATPHVGPGKWVRPMGEPPPSASPSPSPVVETAMRALEAMESAHGDDEAIEIVSNLPPVVIEGASEARRPDRPATRGSGAYSNGAPRITTTLPGIGGRERDEESPRAAFTVPLGRSTKASASGDRVDALLARFQVSRLRDDPALSRDLKEMIGIETSMPPAVAPRDDASMASSSTSPVEIAREEIDAEPTPLTYMPKRRARRTVLALALVTVGFAAFAAARTPYGRATIAKLLAPAAPPPGDVAPKPTTLPAAAPAPTPAKLPTACEAKLDVVNAPKNAEIARKLGPSPLAVAVPTHAPIDLVAVAPGSAPRRAHVDASAPWQDDPTGPRLELPVVLDVGADGAWPSPMPKPTTTPTAPTTPKGLLRVTTNPAGATIWMVAESTTISGLPCGAPVDLQIVAPPAAPRTIHLEWAAFAGAPPHATLTL